MPDFVQPGLRDGTARDDCNTLFAFLDRCEVCGYRRWFHWLTRSEFYTLSHIGPMPKRGWFW